MWEPAISGMEKGAFLFCVPDAHSVSGYPVFSTDAVSVFSFRISFPAFPESAHGIRAGLHTMAPEVCPVTRKITVFVYSRQEKDIAVTCRHRIISEQDILSEIF